MGKKKNITYLVDLENIGTKALCQHIKRNADAEYVIFHSDSTSSPWSILEQAPDTLRISFIDCRGGGNNAMDFCICATAGRMSCQSGNYIVILSNDKGYDPMLYMLHHNGVRITREGIPGSQNTKTDGIIEAKDHGSRENVSVVKAIRKEVPLKYQDDVINALTMAANRKETYEMLQTILPQSIAVDIYHKLKTYIPKAKK